MRYGLGVAAFGAALGWPLAALADPAVAPAPSAGEQQKAEKEVELRGVEDTMRVSDEQRRAIDSEIESIRADRARLTEALISTTAKVQDAERAIAAKDDRVASLNAKADSLSRSLESRRAAIVEVLAALQRMGANPPPAILVKPGDMAEAVRAAMVLSSLVPDLKEQAEALRRDVRDLSETRETIARERAELTRSASSLTIERARLAGLVEARQRSLSSAEEAVAAQQTRAAELARQATTLKELIARLDAEEAQRQAVAAAAHAADERVAKEIAVKAENARAAQSARLAPEIAFADAKGRIPLPVAGTVLKTFGSPDGFGGIEHGVSLATLPGAVVSAPADGSVLFSGPYRTYGQLLIINAGGGYYLLLAGMDHINVATGQFVLMGEPVGAMGEGITRMAAATTVGATRPVLYIELRKDGTAIDPGPWWAKSDIEKARG
ncbi:MAG TPA: peptidoglycan DD-metalloendopeptidase family protein [Roseiarcus sp.]|jgi:septal ring factor EnvC (AmiA/AmiB activator)|nr:peptidoglycan DD-metalloendopeptidase family protein [Roseiarcus sp.]